MKATQILKKQIADLRAGGAGVWRRKALAIVRILHGWSLIGLAVPAVLLIRLFSPFLLIRFFNIRGDRIGHATFDIETYLSEVDCGLHRTRRPKIDIWYSSESYCNEPLFRMWGRVFFLVPGWFAGSVDRLNRKLPLASHHVIPCRVGGNDIHDVLRRTTCHLKFTDEEIAEARGLLTAMGLSAGIPFIGVYARDSMYLRVSKPGENFDYHDYRNASIQNYVPAMREMAGRGIASVRLGSVVSEGLGFQSDMLFDYSNNGHRSELLDLYLCASCEFIIGTASGLDSVAIAFRRPEVTVNFANMDGCKFWQNDHLFIPKKFWLPRESRYMTFREIFEKTRKFYRTDHFTSAGIELRENTPEEISAIVNEMYARLRGEWIEGEIDRELQVRFRKLIPEDLLTGGLKARIGAQFLRQNEGLLA